MKHGKVNLTETEESVSLSKRNTLKWLGAGECPVVRRVTGFFCRRSTGGV